MANKDIGYLIKNINDKLKVRADADLKRYDLTFAQSKVFAFLHSQGGEATQKEIELFLEVSHPTVVGLVSRMEQKGYLVCRVDKTNRRNKLVAFTEKAEALGAEMEAHMRSNEQQLLAPFSAEQITQLRGMLETMYSHLE